MPLEFSLIDRHSKQMMQIYLESTKYDSRSRDGGLSS